MKKLIKITLCSSAMMLLLSGCGKSAVKCDDSEAKKLVLEIAKTEIKNQLTKGVSLYSSSYEQLKNLKVTDDEMIQNKQKMIETVETEYKTISPKLVNIRTNKLDDELEKSECAGDLESLNGNKGAITYKLSKTSEDKLYCEVFGL